MKRPGCSVFLGSIGAILGGWLGASSPAEAQAFGCQVSFREQPRVWIYTDVQGGSSQMELVRVSETVGEVLGDLEPRSGQDRYSFDVIRNNTTRRLFEQLDILSCVAGKMLQVDLTSKKILKNPEDPASFTLVSFTFRLQDHSKLDDTREVEMGPFRLLLADPQNPKLLKTGLSPIIEGGVADCVFQGAAHCHAEVEE